MMHKFKFFEGFIDNTFVYDINMVATHVARGERPLRATWTNQLAEDLYTVNAIDAEAELTALLSNQFAQEIDAEIVRRLTRNINGGGDDDDWDYLRRWIDIGNDRA
jgi:hypothetical protein